MGYLYLSVFSQLIGWIYFVAWSFSFYPQSIMNWRKKSVAGFSLEFAILNVSGFFFYSLYSMGGFLYPHLGTGEIKINDLVFALHAFFMASVQFTQAFIYERGEQKSFALWAVVLLIVEWITLTVVFTLEGLIGIGLLPTAFNTFRVAGYNKAVITFLKYIPQVYLNYSRKSTAGWSMLNVMLDFTGGGLSIVQQVIDMIYNGYTEGNWSFFGDGDGFNIVKFLLGVMSVFFDTIFLTQHFILYRHPAQPAIDDDGAMEIGKPNRHSILAEEDDDEFDTPIEKKNSNNSSTGKINHSDNGARKVSDQSKSR
jgi:LCT (Lysosomal Cystine Transporter) family transporter